MMASLPAEVQASLGASVPFPPRLGRPTEFAAMAMHIFDNTMLNGEVIRLDGAIRMAAKSAPGPGDRSPRPRHPWITAARAEIRDGLGP